MAGLGKYKKGASFTLKSGNKPTFVHMGSSPANMNNFGVGQGGSPYSKKAAKVTEDPTDGMFQKSAAVEYDQNGKKIFPDDPKHSTSKKTTINNNNSIVDGEKTSKTT